MRGENGEEAIVMGVLKGLGHLKKTLAHLRRLEMPAYLSNQPANIIHKLTSTSMNQHPLNSKINES